MDREARNGSGKGGGAGTESKSASQKVGLQIQEKRTFVRGQQVGRVVQVHAADRELTGDALECHNNTLLAAHTFGLALITTQCKSNLAVFLYSYRYVVNQIAVTAK